MFLLFHIILSFCSKYVINVLSSINIDKKFQISGDYKKSYLTFERTWNATCHSEANFTEECPLLGQQPHEIPLPCVPEERASVFQTFIQRFTSRRSSTNSEAEPAEPSIAYVNTNVQGGEKVYLKNVQLLLNGATLQSLSQENATVESDPARYYLFLRSSGCLQSGFANAITLSDWNNAYSIFSMDLSSNNDAFNTV
jgi:hypothetical protein